MPSSRVEMRPLADTARRRLARHRRLVATGLAAAATGSALLGMSPAPAATTSVLAAARDLRAGPLSASDTVPIELPAAAVPRGALRPGSPVRGRLLTAPMRKGEPLTDVRLLGPGLLAGHPPGTVAVPVRIADAGAVRLVSPGDRVDILATPAGGPEASLGVPEDGDSSSWSGGATSTVAERLTVISVPREEEPLGEGAPLVVAATSGQASALAHTQGTARLSLTIRSRSR